MIIARVDREMNMMVTRYIGGPVGVEEVHIELPRPSISYVQPSSYAFPLIPALLQDLQAMSASSSKSGRPRGRRAAPKVPCDDCIARASEKKDAGVDIELCEKCTAILHRPRRKQQEQANTKRTRQQSNAIIDTAL